ncbi:MAG: hypothetical protein WAO75_00880, partial [Atribacterales bacterium]
SFQVEYLFLDAIYESIRKQYGVKEGILCAWEMSRREESPPQLRIGKEEAMKIGWGFCGIW